MINNAVSADAWNNVLNCLQDDVTEQLKLQYYLHYVSIPGEDLSVCSDVTTRFAVTEKRFVSL